MSHPDVPGLPSALLRRQSTHSTPPSTGTRCRYNTQLHAIAKDLENKQGVEDALRAAVHSFVLLETPRVLTPTGTGSTGSSASGAHVSKGVEKLRKYVKAIDQPEEAHSTQPHDAVLIRKAESNMQRYRDFTRVQQMRKVDNREVFAAAVQQAREEETPAEDERVAAYMSVFSSHMPDSVIQARATNSASSGSSSSHKLPSRASRSPGAVASPVTSSIARRNTETPVSPAKVTPRPTVTPPTGPTPVAQHDSLLMHASLDALSNPDTPPSPASLMHRQALHRMDTFVPESGPPCALQTAMSSSLPGHNNPNNEDGCILEVSVRGAPGSPFTTADFGVMPMHGDRRKTQRITFVGLQNDAGDVHITEPLLSNEHATAAALAAAAAVGKTNNGEGENSNLSSEMLEGSAVTVTAVTGTEGGSTARSPPMLGLELSATALESVAESAEEHACMAHGAVAPQVDLAKNAGKGEGGDAHVCGEVAAAIENVGRVKSWKRAAQEHSLRQLAPAASFNAPRGHRRLARRESDVMWLNMAVQDASSPAGLTVGVRKPARVPWEEWQGWSEATQLAYVNGEDLGAVCASVRCKAHHAHTKALLDAVVQHNPPLFDPSEALEAEREVSVRAEVARMQLQELGPADGAKQAAQLHGYKEAILDLNRSRPVFRPCKANAKVPLPAQRQGVNSERRKKVWTLSSSKYFARRRREAESRDFGDMDGILSQQFSADWARVAMKQRFVALIGRSDKDRMAGDSEELQAELNEVRECLEQHKVAIMMMMVYYSNLHLGKWSSKTMKELDLEMFRNMVKDFNLIDPQAPTCRSLNELDSVFVATNFEEGVASAAEDAANDDNALVMFELYEVLVRLSFAKYINSKEMNDASDALDRLLEENVLSNIPEECLVDPNEFRFNRLYTEEVEEVLVKHDAFLHAVFQVYKAADRSKWLWMEHYKQILDVVMLLRDHEYGVSEQDARFLFFWAQSVVRDELRNRQRAVSLVFSDFVELICRLADHVGLPSLDDLEHFYGGRAHLPQHPWGEYYHRQSVTRTGFDRNAVPWWTKGEQEFRSHLQPDEHDRILYHEVYVPLERRPSCEHLLAPQTRPLHLKLVGFLDVMLFYMRDEWGGHDLASCTTELENAARKFGGDHL